MEPPRECLDGGVVGEDKGVVSSDAVGVSNLSEDLGLLDGVDSEIGLELHVGLDVGRFVSSLLSDGFQEIVEDSL